MKFKFQQTKPILQDKKVLDCFNNLHGKFGVVPIEKASDNVAIICKKLYVKNVLHDILVMSGFIKLVLWGPLNGPFLFKLANYFPK